MRLYLRSAPHPGTQSAGPTQPSQPSTRRGSRPQLAPRPTQLSPPAPPPLPSPSLPCLAATQVPQWGAGLELQEGEGEGYRAGATAPSACWRPPVVRPRTTTTLMGLVGREQWRTSTPSTKWVPGHVFFRTVCGVVCKVSDEFGDETLFVHLSIFFIYFSVLSEGKVCSPTLYISQWLLSPGFDKPGEPRQVQAKMLLEVKQTNTEQKLSVKISHIMTQVSQWVEWKGSVLWVSLRKLKFRANVDASACTDFIGRC